ncbi:MAG: hypothetical protein AB8B99_22495 [Phormidesmis sp.]
MALSTFFRSSRFLAHCKTPYAARFSKKVAAVVVAAGAINAASSAVSQPASAQVTVNRDPNTGSVGIDRNAFDIETGPLTNDSNIPLPADLPTATEEAVPLPTGFVDGGLAPNTVNIQTDFDFIEQSFSEQINQQTADDVNVTLQRDSIRTTTEFDLNYVPGEHQFGEGIQITVFDADGNITTQETRFVRGDGVTVGPDGETLPETGNITVEYGIDERVELRILNVRSDNAEPTESGVYFTSDGQLIAEDLPDGGDRDFDDGEYFEVEGGLGQASGIEASETLEVTTTTSESPGEPTIRREAIVEEETSFVESDTVTEVISREVVTRGTIELPDNQIMRLPHAVGARTEDDELLVYDRYARVGQFRAGTDGIGATGQLRPLNRNPKAPPTLLTGDVVVDPFANDNEAILGTTLSVTQFLTRTHRIATNEFGEPVPTPDDSRLLEPSGLLSNRQMVGYVPSRLDAANQGSFVSENGIFEIPTDRGVVIDPPNPQAVGRGDSAYTDNVGGFIVENTNGSLVFVPQWTNAGYEQAPLMLEAGEATRVIYALVPQQSGQNLQLGAVYEVESSGENYQIANGGFTVIAADQYPENFVQEDSEIYAVEDTLAAASNAAIPNFNGVRGRYLNPGATELEETLDVGVPEEADARVGNLFSSTGPGQTPYARTTRAAGFYVGGSLRGGLGNQRDTTRSIVSTTQIETDQLQIVERVNVFSAPVTEVTSTPVETTTTTQRDGVASFTIDEEGLVNEVSFEATGEATTTTATRELESSTEQLLGEETLVSSNTETRTEVLGTDIIEQDVSTVDGSDSYVNAAPVLGELTFGGVLNFGNTPWTPAANTLRAELFAQETVFGRSSDNDSDFGWRAELTFYPFGEVRQDGYQYDADGNVVPIYKTEPVMEDGQQVMETLTAADGTTVEMPVNQFVLDENGDYVPEKVGTGRSDGPGLYVRVEGEFDNGDDTVVNGGLQFTF